MCSTPPTTTRSAAPIAISPAPAVVAVSAPAHIRSTAKPGHGVRQPGEQRDVAAERQALVADLRGRGEDHVADPIGGTLRVAAQQLAHDLDGHVVGPRLPEEAALARPGRTRSGRRRRTPPRAAHAPCGGGYPLTDRSINDRRPTRARARHAAPARPYGAAAVANHAATDRVGDDRRDPDHDGRAEVRAHPANRDVGDDQVDDDQRDDRRARVPAGRRARPTAGGSTRAARGSSRSGTRSRRRSSPRRVPWSCSRSRRRSRSRGRCRRRCRSATTRSGFPSGRACADTIAPNDRESTR